MAILAIVAAIAVPSVRLPSRGPLLGLIATDIAAKLRTARAPAIAQNREIAFAFNAQARTYAVERTGGGWAFASLLDPNRIVNGQAVPGPKLKLSRGLELDSK